MAISFPTLSTEVFNLLRQYGYDCRMYDNDGNKVYEPKDCRRFITKPNHLLVSVIDDGDESGVRLYYDSNFVKIDQIEDLFNSLRAMASKYNVTFTAKASNKSITPKNYHTYSSVSESETPMLYHTSKTTYLTLENARMVAKKSLTEGYEAIQIEDVNHNRFLFPVNDIDAASEMTQHLNTGGSFADAVGQQILNMASHYSELKSAKICESFSEYKTYMESHLTEGPVAQGVDDEACKTCKGSGEDHDELCPACHGTGVDTINVLGGRAVSRLAWEKLLKGQVSMTGTPILPKDRPANPTLMYYFMAATGLLDGHSVIENHTLNNLCSYVAETYPNAGGELKKKMMLFMRHMIQVSGLKINEGFMRSSKAITEFMNWADSFIPNRVLESNVERHDILVPSDPVADLKNEIEIEDPEFPVAQLAEASTDFDGYMGSAKGGTTGPVCKSALEAAKQFFEKHADIKKIKVVPVKHGPNDMVMMYYKVPSYNDVTRKNMADMLSQSETVTEVDMGQAISIADRTHTRKPYWTPEEEKEARALKNHPKFHDEDEEGRAIVAKFHAMKKKANDRYNGVEEDANAEGKCNTMPFYEEAADDWKMLCKEAVDSGLTFNSEIVSYIAENTADPRLAEVMSFPSGYLETLTEWVIQFVSEDFYEEDADRVYADEPQEAVLKELKPDLWEVSLSDEVIGRVGCEQRPNKGTAWFFYVSNGLDPKTGDTLNFGAWADSKQEAIEKLTKEWNRKNI